MAKRRSTTKRPRPRRNEGASRSEYFLQPGKRGAVIVLRKPCGNRATPKICGTMPSRGQAKMLIAQLERAESVVNDLFLEATDDGIEALEAVLAACREAVLRRSGGIGRHGGGRTGEPNFTPPREANPLEQGEAAADATAFDGQADGDEERPYRAAGERG